MTIENIDIQATIKKVQALMVDDEQMSATTKSMFEILIVVITLLANRLNLNSSNSSKPPSTDQNRERQPRKKTDKKAGGQNGHDGITLKTVAMNEMGVLPDFEGILCHDHWKPYYTYDCTHALCNAHHLRELERAWEQDEQKWAKQMKTLLEEINSEVLDAGGVLDIKKSREFRESYKKLLKLADIECPEPPPKKKGKRGRVKKSKSRNLLERLRDFEDDVLRFMETDYVPFTNNLGERDIRMTKVQQKISGCFRSIGGAQIFCRVRSYLSTCRKHGVSSSHALACLFKGTLPDFLLRD